MAKKYKTETIKLSGFGVDGVDGVIERIGGRQPYLWFGTSYECIGILDSIPQVKKLRRLCDEYLASRGKADG